MQISDFGGVCRLRLITACLSGTALQVGAQLPVHSSRQPYETASAYVIAFLHPPRLPYLWQSEGISWEWLGRSSCDATHHR